MLGIHTYHQSAIHVLERCEVWVVKSGPFLKRYGIWIVLLVALVLRVAVLPHAFYGTTGELYRDMLVVHEFLVFGHWPLLGPVSSLGGFYFGPAYYYLLTPFVWAAHFSPIGAVAASGFFSMAALYVAYHLVLRWSGKYSIALLLACLLAISARDIQNAYYISNPNILPFFILLLLYALTLIAEEPRKLFWWGVLGFSFGIATQLHATALLVLPVVCGVAFFRFHFYKYIRGLLMAMAAFVCTYVPYLMYEWGHGFANAARLFQLGGSTYGPIPKLAAFGSILNFWDSTFFFRNDFFSLYEANAALYWVLFFAFALLLGSVVRSVWQKREAFICLPVSTTARILLVTWFIAGTAIFVWYQTAIQFFYFLVLWPLPLMVLSFLLYGVYLIKPKLVFVVCALYVGVQVVQLCYLYPLISHPQFDHARMVRLFSHITTDAGAHHYAVINSFADVNLFHYYMQLVSGKSYKPRANAPIVYTIEDALYHDALAPNKNKYKLESSFTSNGVRVDKYKAIAPE